VVVFSRHWYRKLAWMGDEFLGVFIVITLRERIQLVTCAIQTDESWKNYNQITEGQLENNLPNKPLF